MAISGGDRRIDDGLRQSFSSKLTNRNDTISSTVGSYSSSNVKEGGWFGIGAEDNSKNANDFVGITPEMLNKITTSIDDYTNNLVSALDKMPDAVNYSQGFKGTGIEAAIKGFVTSVKEVCKEYLHSLKAAENQIVESVEKQYTLSDEDIAGQVNTDTSAISGN